MVLCIVGLAIFGILGIFSAKYRYYFRQSLHCMRRQILLKPCDTNFDQELKAKLTGKLSGTPRIARFFYKNFRLISAVLLILMLTSTALVGYGIYNFVLYGNCNGKDSNDFCIYGLLSGSIDEKIKAIKPVSADDGPTIGNPNATVKIVEMGCYSCPYTKDAESIRTQLIAKYGENVSFTFRDMPLPAHNLSFERGEAADCAREQDKYWEYHDKLFEYQDNITSPQDLKNIAVELGLNTTQFNSCYDSRKYQAKVQKDYQDGVDAGIFATPTYFVDGRPFVGLKSFADFEGIVVSEIRGTCGS
jgi:protein-disulfide isomerase